MGKDVFREHFRDYFERERNLGKFDSLASNPVLLSREMARYYADTILRRLSPDLIPDTDEELDDCCLDGSKDCGVDFLSRRANRVLIVQAKYSGGKKTGKKRSEPTDWFDGFCNVLDRLSKAEQHSLSLKLREAVKEIDWERDTFFLHYITLFQPSENALSKAERGIAPLPEYPDIADRTSLELLDEPKLNIRLRDSELSEAPSKSVKVLFSHQDDEPPWLRFEDSHTKRTAYVGRVNGAQLANLFHQYKSGLFTLNIRNYIGNTGTNRKIQETARNNPRDFFYFNNGVCALATRVNPDEDDPRTLICDSFSIINGSQTIRSLAKAQTLSTEAVKDVQVLVRIIEYEAKLKESTQTFLDSVTKFNNTQNSIKLSDFRSNDRVQVALREKFNKLPALDGKKFIYLNKRTGDQDRRNILIPMEGFTKTVHAFEFGPDDMLGGTEYLFDPGSEGGYSRVFGDEIEQQTGITVERFQKLAGTWFLCSNVSERWKTRSAEDREHKGLERRWMVFFAVGESLRTIYALHASDTQLDADLRFLSDPQWLTGMDGRSESIRATIERHYLMAVEALKKAYNSAQKVTEFSHRNWFRSDSSLVDIRNELKSFSFLVKPNWHDYILRKSN
jgi:hypothetical protein